MDVRSSCNTIPPSIAAADAIYLMEYTVDENNGVVSVRAQVLGLLLEDLPAVCTRSKPVIVAEGRNKNSFVLCKRGIIPLPRPATSPETQGALLVDGILFMRTIHSCRLNLPTGWLVCRAWF